MIDRVFDGKDTSWRFSQRGLSDFQGQGPPTKNFHELELLFLKVSILKRPCSRYLREVKSGARAASSKPLENWTTKSSALLDHDGYPSSPLTLEHGVNDQSSDEAPCLVNCLQSNFTETNCDVISIFSHTCATELPHPPR
jgi:hypothetical protein